jgi:hypothetical protein
MMPTRACFLCFTLNCLAVAFDRKGRPYAHCRACNSRMFLHSGEALKGLALMPPVAAEMLAKATAEPAFAAQMENQARAFAEQLRAAVTVPFLPAEVAPTPASTASPKRGAA